MIVGISRGGVSRRARMVVQALVLAVLIFYVLPQLLAFFGQFTHPGPKIREEQLLEKPLRVISEFVEII